MFSKLPKKVVFEAEHNGIMSVTVMEPFTGSNKAMVSSNISGKPGGFGGPTGRISKR